MAINVKIKVLRNDHTGALFPVFRDTTVGNVYSAQLLAAHEADEEGDICGAVAVSFRDDAGDLVLAAVSANVGISFEIVG